MQESSRGADTTARTNVYTCLCTQANRLKHVRTLLIGYRSGGTPGILRNLRARDWIAGRRRGSSACQRPQQPPGSSCCPSLLTGGFRPTTHILCHFLPIHIFYSFDGHDFQTTSVDDKDGDSSILDSLCINLFMMTLSIRKIRWDTGCFSQLVSL